MPRTNLSKPQTPSVTPDPQTPDLTAIFIDRLSDDLVSELDIKELSGRVFLAVLDKLKRSVIHFLSSPSDGFVALNEIEAQNVIPPAK